MENKGLSYLKIKKDIGSLFLNSFGSNFLATLMVMALQDLAATTRRLRTALWCALQMTLPRPIRTPEYHDYEAATCTEKCSVPFEGYSFTLMN